MTKKILFYGNCHLSVVGQWMHENYSDKFEVLDCTDCGLDPFWITSKNFAVWSLENAPKQKDYYKCLHEKIKEADFFIFQPIESNEKFIEEVQTEYLVNNITKGLSIYVSNTRFFAYPLDHLCLKPYVNYIYKNISKEPKVILDILLNDNHPEFEKILYEQYTSSISENKKRHLIYCEKYKNSLDMNMFIEENWKTDLLFATQNHPSEIYWKELIKQIFLYIGEPLDQERLTNIDYPNKTHIVNVFRFSFFNSLFPNINVPASIKKLINPDESLVERSLNHGQNK